MLQSQGVHDTDAHVCSHHRSKHEIKNRTNVIIVYSPDDITTTAPVPLELGMQPHLVAKFFKQYWLDLGKIKAKFRQNLVKIWAKVIRFGQNLASPNTFDLLRL